MTDQQIEALLNEVCDLLTEEVGKASPSGAKAFENRVRDVLTLALKKRRKAPAKFSDQDFPDIVVEDWGVEVKFTEGDKWRTVANSVFEGHRKLEVTRVFLVVCKMGGTPEVRWARYEDAVVHVRTSHRPRFEVEIGASNSLFDKMGVSYADFRACDERAKMRHIRSYARSRLNVGEQLWWLGEDPENPHSLPIAARLYTKLSKDEKIRLRAEATFLCPEVVRTGSARDKYNRAALYLLTYHGVLASQTRDLFSAGSVGNKKNKKGAGKYIRNALRELEPVLRTVAKELDEVLIQEYWGEKPPVSSPKRLQRWLALADDHATDWTPSKELFTAGV